MLVEHVEPRERLGQILNQNRPVTDEEMREIMTMQLRNLMAERRSSSPPPRPGRTKQALFIGLPLALVLGCVLILLILRMIRVFH